MHGERVSRIVRRGFQHGARTPVQTGVGASRTRPALALSLLLPRDLVVLLPRRLRGHGRTQDRPCDVDSQEYAAHPFRQGPRLLESSVTLRRLLCSSECTHGSGSAAVGRKQRGPTLSEAR